MDVHDRHVPDMLYGTAWKEDATEALVTRAIAAGFRGIDTANQRKHYFEAGVGHALRASGIARDELWLQTKFTFVDGQDERLPYDPAAPIATQVAQSFASSLEHLGVARIDSLVLHGPSQRDGLGAADREAWRAMEAIADAGQVTHLGISNINARHLAELIDFAATAPAFVQNRCYAERGWDRELRATCRANDIVYQGFSLLTANRKVVAHATVTELAAHYRKTPAQIIFRFCRQHDMLPLSGTKDPAHMADDLAIDDFELTPRELVAIFDAR